MASDRIPNAETSFVELMALEKVPGKDSTYMSKTPAWASGGAWNAFGGHVYAQACWAAAQEVGDGLVVHSTHGYFTLPGKIDRPYIYTVTPISDTRTMSQRSISVRQPLTASERGMLYHPFAIADAEKPLSAVRFHMICSFKRASPALPSHQESKSFTTQYNSALSGRRPADFGNCPDIDTPWYAELIERFPEQRTFPGLDIRKADFTQYNRDKGPGEYRQLNYYRLLGSIPREMPNLHAAAHLYASDRNSLFLVAHAMGFGDHLARIASLGHSVIFHTDGEGLVMEAEGEEERGWWVQEAWTPRSAEGRGLHESKIWSPTGVHVATTLQDGLVRKAEREEEMMFGGVLKSEEGEGLEEKFGRRRPKEEAAKL